jgi:beta-glucanase (GH16 family)
MMMFSQAPSGYSLVWNDEFNGTELDDTKWKPAPEWHRQGGSYWSDENYEMTGSGQVKLITSERNDSVFCGAIRTHNLFDQKYGYFEVRCKVPQIRGGWTAFWMMPYGNNVGDEGNDGTEIDIFESINGWNNKIQHALHWDGYGAEHQKSSQSFTRSDLYDDAYHTFGMRWTDTEYTFYIDGVQTWQTSAGGVSDVNQYLKLTMEVSGDTWPGNWDDQVEKPIDWLIDYVRVYEYDPTTYYSLEIGESDYGTVTVSPDQMNYASGEVVNLQVATDPSYVFNSWYGTQENLLATIDLTMTQDYIMTPEIVHENELVLNPQFLDAKTGWFEKGATMTVTDGVHTSEIASATTNLWDIQLVQSGLALEDNATYRVTIKASAAQDRSIRAVLGLGETPYTSYGAMNFDITTIPEFYTFDVTSPGAIANARVVINKGTAVGDVYIEEISVVKTGSILGSTELEESSFSVYPNPVSEQVSVLSETPWQKLEVVDANGQVQYSVTDYSAEKRLKLGLQSGVYVLRVHYAEGVKVEALVVE